MVDKAGPTGVARVSHAALVLNPSGHRDTASPAPKERALYLTLSFSLTVSLSLSLCLCLCLSFPFMAACAGIKCIPHEWIAEIRDGSQRVRCLTWIKAKSLAAPAPEVPLSPTLCTLLLPSSHFPTPTPSVFLAYINSASHQCCRHS